MEGDKIQGSTGREIELIKKKRKGVRKKNLINTVCESNTFLEEHGSLENIHCDFVVDDEVCHAKRCITIIQNQ